MCARVAITLPRDPTNRNILDYALKGAALANPHTHPHIPPTPTTALLSATEQQIWPSWWRSRLAVVAALVVRRGVCAPPAGGTGMLGGFTDWYHVVLLGLWPLVLLVLMLLLLEILPLLVLVLVLPALAILRLLLQLWRTAFGKKALRKRPVLKGSGRQ